METCHSHMPLVRWIVVQITDTLYLRCVQCSLTLLPFISIYRYKNRYNFWQIAVASALMLFQISVSRKPLIWNIYRIFVFATELSSPYLPFGCSLLSSIWIDHFRRYRSKSSLAGNVNDDVDDCNDNNINWIMFDTRYLKSQTDTHTNATHHWLWLLGFFLIFLAYVFSCHPCVIHAIWMMWSEPLMLLQMYKHSTMPSNNWINVRRWLYWRR